MAGGGRHVPGQPRRRLGVLGARGVQELRQVLHLHGLHNRRTQNIHGSSRLLRTVSQDRNNFQGFGSSCDGLGLPLTPYNGLRNFVMEKKMRLEKNCDFPSWLRQNSWQIIIQVRSSVF